MIGTFEHCIEKPRWLSNLQGQGFPSRRPSCKLHKFLRGAVGFAMALERVIFVCLWATKSKSQDFEFSSQKFDRDFFFFAGLRLKKAGLS